jgi:hypothetical protein
MSFQYVDAVKTAIVFINAASAYEKFISAKQRIFMIVELQPSGLPKEIFKAFLHW